VSTFVLVHSPVTGPSTWHRVSAELTAQGHEVAVPAVGAVSRWQDFADSAAAQVGDGRDAVLVGHSGAGPVLPQIAERTGAARLVFVDADIPPERGEAELMPAEILAHLRAIAVGGVLPPWSAWFGPDVMRELVPDAQQRAVISAELPRLPVSYFETRIPAPAGWVAASGGCVLLSEAYSAAADAAAARGWPVVRRLGGHLDIVTKPALIADAILSVSG
jgi:hypothetical protein